MLIHHVYGMTLDEKTQKDYHFFVFSRIMNGTVRELVLQLCFD